MSEAKPKTWWCKIGEVHPEMVPPGADSPMRHAVAEAYVRLTGQRPAFISSGWGGALTESERAAHENRLPSEEWLRSERVKDAAPALYAAAVSTLQRLEEDPEQKDGFAARMLRSAIAQADGRAS